MRGSSFEVEPDGSHQVQQLVTLWWRESVCDRERDRERGFRVQGLSVGCLGLRVGGHKFRVQGFGLWVE